MLPSYRRNRHKEGRETPSYVSSAHGEQYPMFPEETPPSNKKQKKNKKPSNGDLPQEPEQIAPYPSVLPEHDANDNTEAVPEEMQQQPPPDHPSDVEMNNIPEDLQSLSDGEEDQRAPNDCDTLLRDEDFNKPRSYDNLPSRDSEV